MADAQAAPVAVRVGSVNPSLILSVLALGGGAYALLQSLVVPALPTLQRDLHTSSSGVAWVFTSYLLAASVVTPIGGRLGDMFGKKRMLVVALSSLAAGTLLGALVTSLPLMIVARSIQGFGGAIFPLAFGIIRDEFPRERVAGGIALVSGLLGIGAGLGIVLAGPILKDLSYHWLFWIPLVVTSAAAVAAVVFIPESRGRQPGHVDWVGGALLSAWLVALLVAVSEAPTWGWASGRTIALFALSAVAAAAWVAAESRSRQPLVDMAMLRLSAVWTTNAAALLLGFGMYSAFVLIPQLVQTPTSTGYGFGASVTQSGLFLVPTTIALLITSPIGGRLSNTVGSKVPLVLGSIVTTGAFVLLAIAGSRWEIYLAATLVGIGVGFAFASMANLIVEAVPSGQTGVATGMNTIVRTIGGAIGVEIAASILAGHALASGLPEKRGYTLTFWTLAGVLVVGVLAAIAVPSRRRREAQASTFVDQSSRGVGADRVAGIVVGIDGSPPAKAALVFALEEARLRNLPLRIVCAWEIPPIEYAGASFRPAPDLATEAERRAEKVLADAVEGIGDQPGITIETVAAAGRPPDVLTEQSAGATLLVVGTRGLGGFASLVLGSVSQSTAHRSSVSLVIVRSAQSDRE